MIYEYSCLKCDSTCEIVKPVSEYDKVENCAECGTVMSRAFAPKKLHLYGTAVEEKYFNHGLGQVVNGKAHVKQICKEKKIIEVGNERPEKHLKIRQQEY